MRVVINKEIEQEGTQANHMAPLRDYSIEASEHRDSKPSIFGRELQLSQSSERRSETLLVDCLQDRPTREVIGSRKCHEMPLKAETGLDLFVGHRRLPLTLIQHCAEILRVWVLVDQE